MESEVDSEGRSGMVDADVQETNFATDDILDRTSTPRIEEGDPLNGYGSVEAPDVVVVPDSNDAQPRENAVQPTKVASVRAVAPDLLRGLLMILMAFDHAAVAIHSWDHGQARETEEDSLPVHEWNLPIGYVIRTLTHLCAPGFTFLLGMGVVYFGRSRTRLGWTAGRMMRHFLIRGAVLTIITVLMGVIFTGGQIWFLNVVLFALAIDYIIAGSLWLVFNKTETWLTQFLSSKKQDAREDGETRPLLANRLRQDISEERSKWAAAVSWHVHNAFLLKLALITIWWNIWLSPTHGHCLIDEAAPISAQMVPENPWLRVWFWTVMKGHVFSGFPPFAWISFAILGLLYGRILLVRTAHPRKLHLETLMASLIFMLLFVCTRLFRFGNLSEECLRMPEQLAHPDRDQYLDSVRSFFYLIKYPPDVAFFAYTMSVNLLLLAFFGALPLWITKRCKVLLAFGTSALFFYLIHQILIFTLGGVLVNYFGRETGAKNPMNGQPEKGIDSVWAYFGFVTAVLAVLYPLCKHYGTFKQRTSPNSIWRFF